MHYYKRKMHLSIHWYFLNFQLILGHTSFRFQIYFSNVSAESNSVSFQFYYFIGVCVFMYICAHACLRMYREKYEGFNSLTHLRDEAYTRFLRNYLPTHLNFLPKLFFHYSLTCVLRKNFKSINTRPQDILFLAPS